MNNNNTEDEILNASTLEEPSCLPAKPINGINTLNSIFLANPLPVTWFSFEYAPTGKKFLVINSGVRNG